MFHRRIIKQGNGDSLPVFLVYYKTSKIVHDGQEISRKEYENKVRNTLQKGGEVLLVNVV